MPDPSSCRRTIIFVFTIFAAWSLWATEPARAQTPFGQGILLVTDWPDDEIKRNGGFDILPYIDTLSIAYRYRQVESRPDLSIVLEWTPGTHAIYHGKRLPLRDIDGYPAIVGLELSADVISGGRRVAEFSLSVDSMIVEASPDIIRIDLPDLVWQNIFVDTPGDVAREIFDAGFELRNATIISAGFALFESGRRLAETEVAKGEGQGGNRPPHVGPRRPRNVSIYRHPGHVDIGLDLFWLIGTRHRRIRLSDDGPRENVGRGKLSGDRRSRSDRGRGAVDRRGGGSGNAGSGEGRDVVDRRRGAEDTGGGVLDAGRRGAVDGSRSGAVGRDRGGAASPRNGEAASPERGEDVRTRSGRDGHEDVQTRGDRRGDEAAAEEGKTAERKGDEEGKEGRARTGIPGLGKSSDDDDDDDDDLLVPYAIAAVAAAGVFAVVGGTVGYYGNARYAPFGLTSGMVRNEGGLLLQVAVNEALIAGEGGPKRLMGRALSFGNIFGSEWVQPALGAGILATSSGGSIEYEPSISVGGVVRHNMILFYGGYDVVQGGPEFSLAVDLRRTGLWGKARE